MTQKGGAELGRGVTARTIHVHRPDVPSDNDTFANIVAFNIARDSRLKTALPWEIYTVPRRPARSATKFVAKKIVVGSIAEKKRIAAIFTNEAARNFVAKDFSTREKFEDELSNMRIFKSVPSNELEQATTLLTPQYSSREGILAVVFPGDSGWFMFSERCDVSVSDMTFHSDADLETFITQTLENFSIIHRHGIIHGDVKMANIMYNTSLRRFKLIDWGKSADEDEMDARYITNKHFVHVNNSSSPMAWMCAGLNYSASLVFMVYVVTRHMERIAMCPSMRTLISHAYASFNTAMYTHFGGNPLLHMDKVISPIVRRKMLRQYMYTFDLYDLALIFTSIICTFRAAFSERMCQRVAGLSKGIVGYGDYNFINSADSALEWWLSTGQDKLSNTSYAPAKSTKTTKSLTTKSSTTKAGKTKSTTTAKSTTAKAVKADATMAKSSMTKVVKAKASIAAKSVKVKPSTR